MHPVIKILKDNSFTVDQAATILRRDRVSKEKLAIMANGDCIFSRSSKLLRDASRLAFELTDLAQHKYRVREIKRLQGKLSRDGGIRLVRS